MSLSSKLSKIASLKVIFEDSAAILDLAVKHPKYRVTTFFLESAHNFTPESVLKPLLPKNPTELQQAPDHVHFKLLENSRKIIYFDVTQKRVPLKLFKIL